MHLESLALELDGVDADVDQDFDSAVEDEAECVTRCRRGDHHAVARGVGGVTGWQHGDTGPHGALAEHRIGYLVERNHRSGQRGVDLDDHTGITGRLGGGGSGQGARARAGHRTLQIGDRNLSGLQFIGVLR